MKETEQIMKLYDELVSSTIYNFPEKGKVNITSNHGVYIIYCPDNFVLHVGMTPYGKGGLNQRLYNNITKTGVFYCEYLKPKNMCLRGTSKFKYIEIKEPRMRALVEALTAGLLCPEHFGTGIKRGG